MIDKDFSDEEAGSEYSSGEEEELAGKEEACEVGAEGGGFRVEAGEKGAGVEGGEELREEDGEAEDDEHGIEDDRQGAVCSGVVSCVAVAVEDGDEGDAGYAADEEVADHVGKLEGGGVGVGQVACAEDVGNVFGADQGENS